jgi:hypothetical protein
MKLKNIIEDLKKSDDYKKTETEEPFFCAGFFILDFEKNDKKIQLDFFLPKKKRIIAFEYPTFNSKTFEDEIENISKQETELSIDIDDIEEKARKIVEEKNIKIIPAKIIAILKDNKWNITIMDKFLTVIRIKLNALTGEEISCEKGSLMDFMGIRKG